MTMLGGGELQFAEYDDEEEPVGLVMPSIRLKDWDKVDDQTLLGLIAAIRLAGSLSRGKPELHFGEIAASIVQIIEGLDKPAPTQPAGAGADAAPSLVTLFPEGLRAGAKPQIPGSPGKLSDFERFDVYRRILRSAEAARAKKRLLPLHLVPDVARSLTIYKTLKDLFLKGVRVKDRSEEVLKGISSRSAAPAKPAELVQLGYDFKLIHTWLDAFGPVPCEVWADDGFGDVLPGGEKGDGQAPPPAEKVKARVPEFNRDARLTLEDVTIVASRPAATATPAKGSNPNDVTAAATTAEKTPASRFLYEYLILRTDEEGRPLANWGDGGLAWIEHKDLRQMLRYAHVDASLVEKRSGEVALSLAAE